MLLLLLCLLLHPPAKEQPPEKPKDLTVTIEGDIDDELAPVAANLKALFYESYPKLLERFENPKKPAPRSIRIIFDTKLKIPAHCSGNRVTVGTQWLKKHPEDFALLTHELTHAVQMYPRGDPGWITEGIADYARYLYGPKEQKNWALPTRLTEKQSYKDSYRTTGKFFVWLDTKYPGTVDKVYRAMQEKTFDLTLFRTATGKSIDELWKECVEEFKQKN